jgi:hypothetical protein
MRGRLEELQGLSARARRADEAESALREYSSAAGEALAEAERRIGEAREAAIAMRDRVAADRAERAQFESRILALAGELQTEREARATGRGRARRPRGAPAAARAAQQAEPRRAARREPRQDPWLPRALRELAARDPEAAIRLGVQLLPAQTLAADDPLDYDLRVEGLGWHAVALGKGRGSIATLHKPRPRRQTDFRLALDAPALGRAAGRRAARARCAGRGARASAGTLRRRRALRRLPAAPLDLADLAEAGVWPDPGLVPRRALAARRSRLDGGRAPSSSASRSPVRAAGAGPSTRREASRSRDPGAAPRHPSATVLDPSGGVPGTPGRTAPERPRARRRFAATWRRWPGSSGGSSGRSATRTERVRRVRESSSRTPRCRPHGRLCWNAP